MTSMLQQPRRQREILVRFVRTEVFEDAALAARARATLGATELRTLDRLAQLEARRDYLAAHALARSMLGRLARSDPARVLVRTSRWGRPEFVPPMGAPRLRFSLSHADGIALCAVTRGCDVGADVESVRHIGADPLAVAAAVCAPRELDALRALPASERGEGFLSLWTRKEAIARAAGLGFRIPLTHILVDGDDGGSPASWGPVHSFRLPPNHYAAVAVLGAPHDAVAFRVAEEMP